MRKIVLLILVTIIIILLIWLSLFLVFRRTSFFGRAEYRSSTANPASAGVSVENSYLFASPLSASVSSGEKIRLTVFLLDGQGRGVAGEAVFLGQPENLQITSVQAVTDDLGRAIFDLSALSAGEFMLEARAANRTLPQRVRVSFK